MHLLVEWMRLRSSAPPGRNARISVHAVQFSQHKRMGTMRKSELRASIVQKTILKTDFNKLDLIGFKSFFISHNIDF